MTCTPNYFNSVTCRISLPASCSAAYFFAKATAYTHSLAAVKFNVKVLRKFITYMQIICNEWTVSVSSSISSAYTKHS